VSQEMDRRFFSLTHFEGTLLARQEPRIRHFYKVIDDYIDGRQ
jgi:hypothetical protein